MPFLAFRLPRSRPAASEFLFRIANRPMPFLALLGDSADDFIDAVELVLESLSAEPWVAKLGKPTVNSLACIYLWKAAARRSDRFSVTRISCPGACEKAKPRFRIDVIWRLIYVLSALSFFFRLISSRSLLSLCQLLISILVLSIPTSHRTKANMQKTSVPYVSGSSKSSWKLPRY